jgi:hypothetical protein
MNGDDAAEREWRRMRFMRNLVWIIPVGMVLGTGLFIGLGFLVSWLWSVTLVDIFRIKAISFWQAWGLILLSQILFKAHIQGRMGTGRRWQHGRHGRGMWGQRPAAETPPPGQEV